MNDKRSYTRCQTNGESTISNKVGLGSNEADLLNSQATFQKRKTMLCESHMI